VPDARLQKQNALGIDHAKGAVIQMSHVSSNQVASRAPLRKARPNPGASPHSSRRINHGEKIRQVVSA
jgi:hypothetical protein